MNPLIAKERSRGWRGDRAQNSYRAAYADARQNALCLHPEIGPDPANAHVLALRVVRGEFPNFAPELLP